MEDCLGKPLSHPFSVYLTLYIAMVVDVITYLFNFLAERCKHQHEDTDHRQRRLRRLYLELVPPFISVTTLVAVTIIGLQQAIEALMDGDLLAPQPDVNIMLLFSALNLLLDVLNVGCFARVNQVIGLETFHHPTPRTPHHHDPELPTEVTQLLDDASIQSDDTTEQELNLNMCSAWTHVCADTLRSVAVLVAAGISRFTGWFTPLQADSWGAIVVSIIILVSLVPLVEALVRTAQKIRWIAKRGGVEVEGK